MTDITEKPTALYRAYDADGQLLYVGIAIDWGHRWSHHRQRSRFYDQVARLDIEWLPTRAAAIAAEIKAIADEQPLHNIEHTARDTRPPRFRSSTDRPELYARDFDHSPHLRNDEYHTTFAAIDALANSRIEVPGQEGLVQLVAEMARSVPYGDTCRPCRRNTDGTAEDWLKATITYPHEVEVQGSQLKATYQHHCGTTWNTWWAIDAPLWMP